MGVFRVEDRYGSGEVQHALLQRKGHPDRGHERCEVGSIPQRTKYEPLDQDAHDRACRDSGQKRERQYGVAV